jgi:hypothetical protein
MCSNRYILRVPRRVLQALALALLSTAIPVAAQLDLDGKQIDPVANSAGNVVVLLFVRTDCPISNRYAPSIQGLSSQYAGKAIFWLVYPDKRESPVSIRKHLQDYGYKNLTALRDPQHVLVKRSQAQVTPEAAVFDHSGRLVYHGRIDNWYQEFGRVRSIPTSHELDDAIRAALVGRPVANTAVSAVGCYISDLE